MHLYLHVSPHHSPCLHSLYLSLLVQSFTRHSKLICSTNPFLHTLSGSIWIANTDYELGPDLVGITVCCFNFFIFGYVC